MLMLETSKNSSTRRIEIKRELKKNILIKKQESLLHVKDENLEKLEKLRKAMESVHRYKIRKNPLKKIKALRILMSFYPQIFS